MKVSLMHDSLDKIDMKALASWLTQEEMPQLTMGKQTEAFEEVFSIKQRCKYSIFVNSGSTANFLMIYLMKELGMLKNNKVVVPTLSWSTTVAPIIQLGLEPILCDACKDTLGVDIEHLERIFKKDTPSALFIVHVLGFMCKMNEIEALCKKYGVILLEDNCESMGSQYNGIKSGNFGLMSSFSFFWSHHISTIEGGMICTNDEEIYVKLKMLRSHGWTRNLTDAEKRKYGYMDIWDNKFKERFKFYMPAFNFRSTDLQAFLGLRQMNKVENIFQQRQNNYDLYQKHIHNPYWKVNPTTKQNVISNFAYPVIHPKIKKVIKALEDNDIETRPLIAGSMQEHPMWTRTQGFGHTSLPFGYDIHNHGIYLPNNQLLQEEQIKFVCKIVNKELNR